MSENRDFDYEAEALERRVYPIWIMGAYRLVPGDWWREMLGPKPPFTWRDSDGCSYSPDVLPVSEYVLWPACMVHDWHYGHHGGLRIGRLRADWILARNIFRLMRLQGAGLVHATSVAFLYFQGVRRFGGLAWEQHRQMNRGDANDDS